MRTTIKTSTLENKFPLLAVENNYIISKFADITTAYRVQLPELFTISAPEYKAMHAVWLKAVRVLPDYSILHKQDWFLKENYTPVQNPDASFLQRNFENHFNERPFLNHTCYLFLTKTTKEQSRMQSNFNSLCRGFIIPKEISQDTITKFLEAVEQFERIINDSGLITLTRLTSAEITGTAQRAGILEKYFSLCQDDNTVLQDISMMPEGLRIGDNRVCLHTLSDVDYLPNKVDIDARYERYSTDKTDCKLSFASPVGLQLNCNHIYNQYLFIDDSAGNLRQFEKLAKNMHSLAKYSRANQINREWIELYLNEAHSKGLQSIRAHFNVFAWADNAEELKRIKNECGSQIAVMDCKPHHNTVDAPTLFWAGMPGNAGDFPSEESFYTFPDQAICFFIGETNYRDSLSTFGIKMVDRLTGKPLHLDISDLPMKKGIITNRNKFVLGGSGSGKSFFTNHLMRQYWEQNTHILIVDTGNSYLGLCTLIHEITNGNDGIYYTYTEQKPISFNPFYTEDNAFDIEKKESIKTLLLTLWKKDTEQPTRSEETALSNAVNLYVQEIQNNPALLPGFDTFYKFIKHDYRDILVKTNVREKDFDIDNFLNVLAPYYSGGEYDYLLNAKDNIDLLNKRFVVFELDNIKDHPILFPVVTIIIMETFISKMRYFYILL